MKALCRKLQNRVRLLWPSVFCVALENIAPGCTEKKIKQRLLWYLFWFCHEICVLAFKVIWQHLWWCVSQSSVIKPLRACSYPLLRLLLNVFETPCTVSGCLVKRSLVCDLPANNISKMEAKALPYFNCNFGTIIRFKYPICSRQVDSLWMNMHANLRNLTKST